MCLRVAGVGQRAQVGSSPYHWWRFFGDGSTSYVALRMKLILLASISQRSLQPSFLFSRPSHLIHCPCLTSETAFAVLSASSWRRTSSTTIFLLSDVVALRQVGLLVVRPKPPLPIWTCPTMSLCLRAAVACRTASDGVHFRPVDRGGAVDLMVWSLESVSVIWSLTLEHLYSSVVAKILLT